MTEGSLSGENLQLRFSNSSRRGDIDRTQAFRFYRMSRSAYLSIARKRAAGKRLINEPPIKLAYFLSLSLLFPFRSCFPNPASRSESLAGNFEAPHS